MLQPSALYSNCLNNAFPVKNEITNLMLMMQKSPTMLMIVGLFSNKHLILKDRSSEHKSSLKWL